jgi:hypothetical protein
MTLRRYGLWVGSWSLLFWGLFLGLGAFGGYDLVARGGTLPLGRAVWLACWSGLFVGFVASLSSTLQLRRNLLIGLLDPSPAEMQRLEALQPPARPSGFWLHHLAAAVGLATVSGGSMVLSVGAAGDGGAGRLEYMLATFGLPAVGGAAVAVWTSRFGLQRFLADLEHDRVRRFDRRWYLLVHNVLPYAVFSTLVGVAAATARFLPLAYAGKPVPTPALARHLATAVLLIALLVVAAARIKTRLDFLSPLELAGRWGSGGWRWRLWYALLAPLLTYLGLRAVFWGLAVEELEFGTALLVKAGVCLTAALVTAWWAVGTTLRELERGGLDDHRYVRVHRFLRRTGFFN